MGQDEVCNCAGVVQIQLGERDAVERLIAGDRNNMRISPGEAAACRQKDDEFQALDGPTF